MNDKAPKTRKGVANQDFTDAGTGESFKTGDEVSLEAGVFDNYEHAGLVRKPSDPEPKATSAA